MAWIWCSALLWSGWSRPLQWPQGMSMFTVMKFWLCILYTVLQHTSHTNNTNTMNVSLQKKRSCNVVELNTGSMQPLTDSPLALIIKLCWEWSHSTYVYASVYWETYQELLLYSMEEAGFLWNIVHSSHVIRIPEHTHEYTSQYIHGCTHIGTCMWACHMPVHMTPTITICSLNDTST